jgi:addiction module HigA family antidote
MISGESVSSGVAAMPTASKSSIITEGNVAMRKMNPIHPGEILREEFLEPMGVSQYRLAKDVSVPPRRINEIVHGKRAISADTALRLARYFGMEAQFWLNLQSRYDLEVAEEALAGRLEREVHPHEGRAA